MRYGEDPIHVDCASIGNKEMIAAKHYLRVTDEEYERASGGLFVLFDANPDRDIESARQSKGDSVYRLAEWVGSFHGSVKRRRGECSIIDHPDDQLFVVIRVGTWASGLVTTDTESWEQKLAQTLEDMPEVIRYVKNHNLGFTIPYTLNGEEHQYFPDFIACMDDGHGLEDLLNLIVEGTGEKKKDKAAKVATARTLWVPAINNHGGLGRWGFVEIGDPWDAQYLIRVSLQQ
jgi:hypothetical protein